MTKGEMKALKEVMTEAMTEAIVEVLWSDGFTDKHCDLVSDVFDYYLETKEAHLCTDENGKFFETYTSVTIAEYLQNIERLLYRIADALGA